MQSKLLIINCPSEYFFHIPMGSFGLCDYLGKRNIPVKLLNLAVYAEDEREAVLEHYLELFRPTHVGIILHWQETLEGFLRTGRQVRSHKKDIKIIGGGFTAGYFGLTLLERCGFLDFVIKGDPEKPLELLMRGEKLNKIPNLIYRSPSGIRSNRSSFFIDQETLSGLLFSGLSFLYDYELYIDAMNKKLGFPVFVGRGCIHNCRYCGGSVSAFRLHSGRTRPVTRSIESIVFDLERLKGFTKKIYICHENDQTYIKTLFRAMKEEKTLAKAFHLNYGAWQLPDEEFLELYKELFISSGDMKPVFELSPEVFDDKARKKIKPGRVYYSIEGLRENLTLIKEHLGNMINTSVFFSRYHDSAGTYPRMKEEIKGITRLKHELVRKDLLNVRIFYDHLSTDVASRCWEDHMRTPKDFGTLINAIRRFKTGRSFPADNLCIHMPEMLSEDQILRCESLIFVLKALEKYAFEMFHIMFGCLDEKFVDLIEDVIPISGSRKGPRNFFTAFDHHGLINLLKQKIAADAALLERIPFGLDLIDLFIRKGAVTRESIDLRPDCGKKPVRLNHKFLSVHAHDYLDLVRFLKRLDKEGTDNLKSEKTVCIFLAAEILTMPYATFDLTLKEFDEGITVEHYLDMMQRKGIFTPAYHEELVKKLIRNKVLFCPPVAHPNPLPRT